MKITQIIECFNQDYPVPGSAIKSAESQQHEITPVLLATLKKIVDYPDKVDFSCKADLMAVYMLAKFRETQAFPYIIQMAGFPEEWVECFWGDTKTEALSRFIVSTYDGNLQAMKMLVENEKANIWCRAAALSSFLGLFAINVLSRNEVIDYHRHLINSTLVEDSEFATQLAHDIYRLYPQELYTELMNLFDRNLVDEFMFGGKEEVDKQLALGIEKCLQEEIYGYKYHLPISNVEEDVVWLYSNDDDEEKVKPICKQRIVVKIGRNEPCPCSSGKKYKFCCINKKCGLCGNQGKLTKTMCCNNWICDDEDQYALFSYANNSCYRNHSRHTLCGVHYSEKHVGRWQDCEECRKLYDGPMYAYFATNDHNFEPLINPPKYDPIHCYQCAKIIKLDVEACTRTEKGYICEKCQPMD